jgi:sorbitol-specific phosphotransferase system component IIBC
MPTVHTPMIGDLAVARVLSPKVVHITGPGATLCGLWALSKLTLPGAVRAQTLPLCHACQRARNET